jgi:arylsulfatase A-like enzyme
MGKSWGPLLADKVDSPRTGQDFLAWEIFGNRAVRQGDWKLRWEYKPFGKGEWELYNLAVDPAERDDLAAKQPERVKALLALWDDYVKANNVVLPSRSMFETLDDQLPKRVPDDAGYPPLIYKRQFVPPANLVTDPAP